MKIQNISRNNDTSRIDQKNRILSPNGNDQRTKRKEGERRWREEIEIMIKRVLKKGEKQKKKIGEKGWRR